MIEEFTGYSYKSFGSVVFDSIEELKEAIKEHDLILDESKVSSARYFRIKCDRCKNQFVTLFTTLQEAQYIADTNGWERRDNRVVCPACQTKRRV